MPEVWAQVSGQIAQGHEGKLLCYSGYDPEGSDHGLSHEYA